MKTIGLDPATSTGYAWTDGKIVRSGVWRLTSGNQGAAINDLRRELRGLVALGCDRIAYELASYGAGQGKRKGGFQFRTMAYHNALRGAIDALAHEFDIPIWCYHPSTIKLQTTGSGRATKQQVLATVRTRWGVECSSFDEADAVAIAMLAAQGYVPPQVQNRARKKRIRKAIKKQARLF